MKRSCNLVSSKLLRDGDVARADLANERVVAQVAVDEILILSALLGVTCKEKLNKREREKMSKMLYKEKETSGEQKQKNII
jgi:hypothetical protein